ncbi:holo-ACP synthase [Caproicibacterium sp. BJN0003]|uniref:holo-ACP synthase n=1 Tax=Caproicibacterium sp. BJN0003 TaxID=2994078 RepID=UPI002250003F|nr:holo-ACP synthase [Caproicibacterium sp. BJN0003]UZT81207.1 holo-ACP synthase [Caproicibacterium sp. BJN0003]
MDAVGIDLCEISRIKESMKRESFCRRILGQREFLELQKRGFPPQSVAASFSAKEAFSKAVGTGLHGFSLCEVELLHRGNGAPYLHFSGKAARLAFGKEFMVSVSHTDTLVTVIVIGKEISNGTDLGKIRPFDFKAQGTECQ